MSSSPPVAIRQLRGRMRRSIFFIFLPISLIPTLVLVSVLLLFRFKLLAEEAPSAPGTFLAGLPASSLLAGGLIFLISLVVAVLLTWLAARYLTWPLDDLVSAMSQFVQGDREARALIDRPNEIGMAASLFNQMANELTDPSRVLPSEGSEPVGKRQAISQLSQLAAQGTDLDDFLGRVLDLIVAHYGCSLGGVYLLEQAGPLGPNLAALRHSIGASEIASPSLSHRFEVKAVDIDSSTTTEWMIRKAIEAHRTQVGPPVEEPGMLEAAIPLVKGEQVLGVLDLFTGPRAAEGGTGSFSSRILSDLQAIANITSLAVASARPMTTEIPSEGITAVAPDANVQATNRIYQASHPIAHAESVQQVFDDVARVLQDSPFTWSILMKDEERGAGRLHLIQQSTSQAIPRRSRISILDSAERASTYEAESSVSIAAVAPFFVVPERLTPRPVVVTDINTSPLPPELLDISRQMGCDSTAFIPVLRSGQVVALLALGKSSASRQDLPYFSMQTLDPYINLIELMVLTVEKIQTQQGTQRRLAELQTIWNISQTISRETDLGTLFRVIHEQVEYVMGEINSFAIALYEAEMDSIQIPYMVEAGRKMEVSPFPLGEGLTSIVVRTRSPLLLVSDTEARARALGAKVVGVPARSWLGVPLLFGGEVIGAIILQDIDHEYRFSEEDEHLLSTLAAQVAVVVRNAWLLETTRLRAEQERMLNDITAKIRRSVDIQTILKTTADELGAALGARRAHIEITRPGLLKPVDSEPSTSNAPGSVGEPEEVAG